MEEALQHEEAPQRIGLQTTGAGNHHADGSEANDALTIKLDQSDEAAHNHYDDPKATMVTDLAPIIEYMESFGL